MNQQNRIYELDWLRVFLIFAVFIHHVLMPFNGDGWHIMNAESSKLLDDIMVYFEQFRLPALFFIAGAGGYLLLCKISAKRFFKDKLHRLLIPFIVGMVLVIPPQSYFEEPSAYDSLWQAYPELAIKFQANHLWFIEYLLVFSLLAIPLFKLINSERFAPLFERFEKYTFKRGGLFSWVILLIIMRVVLKTYFPSDGHTIANVPLALFYFWFFLMGMLLIKSPKLWQSLSTNLNFHTLCLVISSICFYAYYFSPDLSSYLSLTTRWNIWWLVCSLVAWSALLTLLGYGQKYLNSRPNWLKLCNELIYPFYIFHQTVIVVLGYFVIQMTWALSVKALVLLLLSFVVTASLCLLLVYPFNLTRYLFGLKKK